MQILDEALNFLNTGNIHLQHDQNFFNTYDKISHISCEKDSGFYKFHDELKKKINSILKPYGLTCKLFGVYTDKNSLRVSRVCTLLIEKGKLDDTDYGVQVEKLMGDFKSKDLLPKLGKLNKSKVEVTDVNYCYTTLYRVYSIDVYYSKK